MMSKIVAAIFPDKPKADEGNLALKKLVADGIAVHASVIVSRTSDSKLSVVEYAYEGSHVTAAAALIGGLAGLPGGPIAAAMGAAGGALIGIAVELTEKGHQTRFLDRISDKLAPGRAALVADIAEEGTSSFEARMGALGGIIFRQP
jgi:uncharacterized membrane protein